MFSTIFKKELLDQLLSPKFLIVFFLCLVLIPPSFLMNYANYKNSLKEYEFLKQSSRENLKATVMRTLSLEEFRRPSLLSVFGLGLERTLSKMVIFEKYETKTRGTTAEGETLSNIAGKVDFVYIAGYLLGLFAILYGSILIVNEKEDGTLKLILSNNAKRSTFLFAKFLAGYTVLIIPLFASFLLGLLILLPSGFPLFSGENIWRILFLLLMSLIFISTFFALGILISTRAYKSSMALISGFLVWVLLVLIIPKISEPVAKLVHPIQSDETVKMNITSVIYQLKKEQARELIIPHQEAEKTMDFKNYYKAVSSTEGKYDEKIGKATSEIESRHQRENEFSTSLSLLFSRLSPYSNYINSALNFCYTGFADRDKFYRDVHSHRVQLEDPFFKHVSWNINLSKNEKGEEEVSGSGWSVRADYSNLPEFDFKFLTIAETVRKSLIDILLLVLYNLIFFATAYFSFIRYDVR